MTRKQKQIYLRDYAEPLPRALDRRNGARPIDWIIAGALVFLGLLVFGGAIWTVFSDFTASMSTSLHPF